MIKSFLDLDVYKESFSLSLQLEHLIRSFPKYELYLLVDQMRRASRAIPALIAEGYAKRESEKEFKKFLRDALAEANEVINHLALAKAREYVSEALLDDLIDSYHILGRKLYKLKLNWKKY